MGIRRLEAAGNYARLVSREVRSQMGIKRISGARLADACNISQSYLSKRLRDELPFTLNDIEEIAEALGLDYVSLVIPAARIFDERERA